MAEHPLDFAAMAAYGAFAISATSRLGQMPDWQHVPPEARADWRAVADAVRMVVAADERQRIYAEIGSDHHVTFTEDRWTVEHSLECRLSGQMPQCAYHQAIAAIAADFEPADLGRWRIASISEGLPDLERADD